MTTPYRAPLADLQFLFERVLDVRALTALPAFAALDDELVRSVLAEGARLAEQVLAPLNAVGDVHPAALIDGEVRYPPGFAQGYRQFCEGGWVGFDLPESMGGQGMPRILQAAFSEMSNGANVAFSMLPVAARAGARLLLAHGTPTQVRDWVPALADGSCTATIVITEPQAGSDVGRIRALATEAADGTWRLSGTKVFISHGDNDFAAKQLHLVLARTPDAVPGTRGLSLFLVPKWLASGERNGVRVTRVEHKMGLASSPTCVLEFEDAWAQRVGEPGRGLSSMFTMVNTMRLEVAVQGVGIAGAALNRAVQHALERAQGGPPGRPPRPIIDHADVRRMLLIMRARTEGLRALVLEAALQLDLAEHHPAAEVAASAAGVAQWLLPICKACCTEAGTEVANLAVQVFGGSGYIRDVGVEQYVRDARVGAIYEGTNGMQALDLVKRKLLEDGGGRLQDFLAGVRATLAQVPAREDLEVLLASLREALALLEGVSDELLRAASQDRQADVEAGATAYLRLAGLVACGWMWLRMAVCATDDSDLQTGKRMTARFFAHYLLPEAALLAKQVSLGAAAAPTFSAAQWAAGW